MKNFFHVYDDYVHHHATRYVKLPLACLRPTEHGYHELHPDQQHAELNEVFGMFTNSLEDMLYYRSNMHEATQEYEDTRTDIQLPDDFVERFVTKHDDHILIKLVWGGEYTNDGEYTTTLADCLKTTQCVTLMPVDAIDESTCYGEGFIPDWFYDVRICVIHTEEYGVVAECLDSSDYYRLYFVCYQGVMDVEIPTIVCKLSEYVKKSGVELVIEKDGCLLPITPLHSDTHIRFVDLRQSDDCKQLVVDFVDYNNPDLCYFLNLNDVSTDYLEYVFTHRLMQSSPIKLAA